MKKYLILALILIFSSCATIRADEIIKIKEIRTIIATQTKIINAFCIENNTFISVTTNDKLTFVGEGENGEDLILLNNSETSTDKVSDEKCMTTEDFGDLVEKNKKSKLDKKLSS